MQDKQAVTVYVPVIKSTSQDTMMPLTGYFCTPDEWKEIQDRINAPKDKWIRVEDRLPEENKYVILFGKGNRQFTSLFNSGVFLAYNPFNDIVEECEEVTHWMPLPTSPTK
jgi:hypothetical protein